MMKISFEQKYQDSSAMTDAEFIQAIEWTGKADSSLKELLKSEQNEETLSKLANNLRKSFPKPDSKVLRRKKYGSLFEIPVTLWSAKSFPESESTLALVLIRKGWEISPDKSNTKSGKKKSKKNKPDSQNQNSPCEELEEWLDQSFKANSSNPYELILLLDILFLFSGKMKESLFWKLWRTTLTACRKYLDQQSSLAAGNASPDQLALVYGEVAFLAGHLFNRIKGASKVAKEGRKFLVSDLDNQTDTDGTPSSEILNHADLWLAVFVRCTLWSQLLDEKLWSNAQAERLSELILSLSTICDLEGRIAMTENRSESAVSILLAGATLLDWKKSSPESKFLHSIENGTSVKTNKNGSKKPVRKKIKEEEIPSRQSDWGNLGILRASWEKYADWCCIDYSALYPRIELSANGHSLLAGKWGFDIKVDGKKDEAKEDWSCSCWHSDKDADYIELELELKSGVVISRHVLLSRTDQYAVLADNIFNGMDHRIDYKSRLPLSEDILVEADVPTRECRLLDQKLTCRAFPLGLPADRVLSAAGHFGMENGKLELQQSAEGGLYAPVVLDWNPARLHDERDWKKLTVCEDGVDLKTSLANAYRLRMAKEQLLMFRSLIPGRFPRSVLGHHTMNETVIGMFDRDGEVSPILIVEYDEED